jgi:hypothetical protein
MPYLAPTSGWGEEVSSGKTSVGHGRHGFDLDKLVCVVQHGHSHGCARYTVLAESLSPRARWRMTSRPRSGFVVDSLFALSSATNIYFAISTPTNLTFRFVADAVFDGALVFLFLRSSVRMQRVPPETVPELEGPPLWKPIKC